MKNQRGKFNYRRAFRTIAINRRREKSKDRLKLSPKLVDICFIY